MITRLLVVNGKSLIAAIFCLTQYCTVSALDLTCFVSQSIFLHCPQAVFQNVFRDEISYITIEDRMQFVVNG